MDSIQDIRIIEENADYLVVNKPAGLLTHGAPHLQEDNLIDRLLEKYPDIAKASEDPDRPGIMQRLDKLASGLLVIARSNESFEDLKRQFKERTVEKEYSALVFGKIDEIEREINFPIKRSSKGFKMAALPETKDKAQNDEGVAARTIFTVEKNYINYTLLRVRIKTGRTHQIRVHMSAYGHPLVGDDLYGTKKTRILNKKLDLGRIFLVSRHLAFNKLNGERVEYDIEIPAELKNFLTTIK